MQPKSFRYGEDAGIATITLDRPDRLNALTFEVYAELRDLFAELAGHDAVRAIIITGEGRGFCSGGDVDAIIGRLLNQAMPERLAFTRMTGAQIRNIRVVPKPVIAAINGVAAGAGAVIALASDFRIAVPGASLAFLFTKVGLAGADMGAAYLLPRVVGLARATELLMLGDRVTAEEALRIGLVNRVVAPERLMDEARALAERLAAGPSFALGMTKTLLNQELDADFAAAIEAEAQGQAICMQTPSFREAYEAFQKRPRPPAETRPERSGSE
ncbi:MAG TPA: enoyl-CoA hydratase family protein [Vicinamibacterales bacterium]|nr:enoyl-CoA hydratase family protein [Vicinamibacterales bacterium]